MSLEPAPKEEAPFAPPEASVTVDEEVGVPRPSERHYRPRSRVWTMLRQWLVFGLLIAGSAASGWLSMVGLQLLMVLAAVVILVFLGGRRQVPAWVKRNEAAAASLASGDISSAADDFEVLCRQAKSSPLLHALVVFNRGVAYLHQHQPERALQLFSAVLDSRWTLSQQIPNFHLMVLSEVSVALAVVGRAEAAERFLRQARDHLGAGSRGRLSLASALVALRAGDLGRAASHIEAEWKAAEGSMGPSGMRALRVLWAFALESGPVERRDDRLVRRLIDGLWPSPLGEQDYLAVQWPELASFLLRHGLAGGAT